MVYGTHRGVLAPPRVADSFPVRVRFLLDFETLQALLLR